MFPHFGSSVGYHDRDDVYLGERFSWFLLLWGVFFLSPFLLREMDMGVIGDLRWWMLDNVKQERIRERSIAQ